MKKTFENKDTAPSIWQTTTLMLLKNYIIFFTIRNLTLTSVHKLSMNSILIFLILIMSLVVLMKQ